LLSTGTNVTYIDISLTPIIHFLTCQEDFDAGVMVTASHNPANFNGFRIDLKNAKPLYGEELAKLPDIIEKGAFPSGKKGMYLEMNLSEMYIDFIKSRFSFVKKFKVAIDCGSGASSIIAPKLFKKLGFEVLPVYCEYNSNFPHGVPDPKIRYF